ncbi:hypothetical protein IG631_05594 [Alternaria alternata]|nr:hypothetical protein IG631_05594 [Alternaria alternata]
MSPITTYRPHIAATQPWLYVKKRIAALHAASQGGGCAMSSTTQFSIAAIAWLAGNSGRRDIGSAIRPIFLDRTQYERAGKRA